MLIIANIFYLEFYTIGKIIIVCAISSYVACQLSRYHHKKAEEKHRRKNEEQLKEKEAKRITKEKDELARTDFLNEFNIWSENIINKIPRKLPIVHDVMLLDETQKANLALYEKLKWVEKIASFKFDVICDALGKLGLPTISCMDIFKLTTSYAWTEITNYNENNHIGNPNMPIKFSNGQMVLHKIEHYKSKIPESVLNLIRQVSNLTVALPKSESLTQSAFGVCTFKDKEVFFGIIPKTAECSFFSIIDKSKKDDYYLYLLGISETSKEIEKV